MSVDGSSNMKIDKRAVLFEYFKTTNSPKWAKDGSRLYATLREVPDAKIDSMYQRMIQLQAREALLKKQKETPMYKRWKMPLALLALWIGFATLDVISTVPNLMNCMLCAFIAGSYFQELMSNAIYNLVEYKHRSKNEEV